MSVDPVRYFDALGRCACGCGKPATGVLRAPGNASYGAYREQCAEKRLAKARKEQERATGGGER